MSETIHIVGDLSGLEKTLAKWKKAKVDDQAVGELGEHLGPLQKKVTVLKALQMLEAASGSGHSREIDDDDGLVSIRAVLSDHDLHDVAAPLIGAFRIAGTLGAEGELILAASFTDDTPHFGHRLDVDGTGAQVRPMTAKERVAARLVFVMAFAPRLARGRLLQHRPLPHRATTRIRRRPA